MATRQWSRADMDRLGAAYAQGGLPAAHALFPEVSLSALKNRVFSAGFRRDASGQNLRRASVRARWSSEDLQRLRAAYAQGGMAAARAAFPDRSESAIASKCASEGFRRYGETVTAPGPQVIATTTSPPPTAPAAPALRLRAGQFISPRMLDTGDAEIVRRRIAHAVDVLAIELRCYPSNVRAALVALLKTDLKGHGVAPVEADDIPRT